MKGGLAGVERELADVITPGLHVGWTLADKLLWKEPIASRSQPGYTPHFLNPLVMFNAVKECTYHPAGM